MPDVTTNISSFSKGATDLARDAVYVAVGLGVLGYQRVQVHRVELQNRLTQDLALDQHIDEVRQGVAKGFRQIDDLTESAVRLVESTLQPLEERLPPSVTQVSTKAREQAREVRTQIRLRVRAA
jgi:CRISPR/Cas system endoribonuclease Cas6 (RAMP superfamily)